MQWSEVLENPALQNLPFKIELNRYGKIEMSPASNKHGRLQIFLATALQRKLKKGEALAECSISTLDGIKFAKIAWCSNTFLKKHGYETPYSRAPELCVEIVSPSNSREEMANKVLWYLEAGAMEVWVVWENGIIDYYDKSGQLSQSNYAPEIKIPAKFSTLN